MRIDLETYKKYAAAAWAIARNGRDVIVDAGDGQTMLLGACEPGPVVGLRRARWSGSQAQRVICCPASAVLPRVRREGVDADVGSAIHDHLADRAHGLEVAIERLDAVIAGWHLPEREAAIARAKCLAFEFMPPRGAVPELALCLLEDGSVVQIEGGRGEYMVPERAVMPMTLDLVWSEPEPLERVDGGGLRCPPGSTLFVVEYKTGDTANVAPIERNAQALGGALLAARFTGAARVVASVCFVRAGEGLWDTLPAPLEAAELDELERDLRDAAARVEEQARRLEAGEPLELVEGPHCTYCPAEARCGAKTASLRALLGAPPTALGDAPLSRDEARRLAELLPAAEAVLRRARAALEAYVAAEGPIDLDDGVVWGPEERTRESIAPRRALPVLQTELGDDYLDAIAVSRESIERVVRARLEREGIARGGAAAMRDIMGALARGSALEKRTETWWRAHRAEPEEKRA